MASSIARLLKITPPTHPFPSTTPLSAVILLPGAGGGWHGPASTYPTLASTLSSSPLLPILTVQLDYTEPSYLPSSVLNVSHALSHLLSTHPTLRHVVFMGWSFGGAVAITAASSPLPSPRLRTAGLITLGTQTAGTAGIVKAHAGGVEGLFLHGGGDTCLPARCSREVWERFAGAKELVVYEGDDHGCSRHRREVVERVTAFCVRVLQQRLREEAGGGAAAGKENAGVAKAQQKIIID